MAKNECVHQKLNGTESQRTPKEVARAIRYSGLGVRSVGPVGEFLECVTGVMTPWKWSSGPLLNYKLLGAHHVDGVFRREREFRNDWGI